MGKEYRERKKAEKARRRILDSTERPRMYGEHTSDFLYFIDDVEPSYSIEQPDTTQINVTAMYRNAPRIRHLGIPPGFISLKHVAEILSSDCIKCANTALTEGDETYYTCVCKVHRFTHRLVKHNFNCYEFVPSEEYLQSLEHFNSEEYKRACIALGDPAYKVAVETKTQYIKKKKNPRDGENKIEKKGEIDLEWLL